MDKVKKKKHFLPYLISSFSKCRPLQSLQKRVASLWRNFIFLCKLLQRHLSHLMTKLTKYYAPSEASDQPGHPPSLSRVFAFRMKKAWLHSYPLSALQRLWSDWTDAQADLSLRSVHRHFVGFVMRRLISRNRNVQVLVYSSHKRRVQHNQGRFIILILDFLRPKKIYMCVSGFPTLPRFFPDSKHFIVNYEQNVVKYAGKWGKKYWKMQFLYKIFWQNKMLCGPTIPSFFRAETWNIHIFFLALHVLYIYSSHSALNREKWARLGSLSLPNRPLGLSPECLYLGWYSYDKRVSWSFSRNFSESVKGASHREMWKLFWVPSWQNQRSDFVSSKDADQSLRWALNGYLRTQAFFMRTGKSQIRLGAHSFCWFCQVENVFISWPVSIHCIFLIWALSRENLSLGFATR